ncbi:MAG: flagellar protein FlgN [Lachnospiraceae bacterium]|nr:flagellar protein FlgN [Lachnospiraceae bacterium]
MASLIENLITGLNEEYVIYEKLLEVSMEKTSSIISNNLDRLKATTDKEQELVDAITSLEVKRNNTMANIASVLNKKAVDLKISDVVTFLDGQPEFQDPLKEINEKLAKIARKLKEVNAHNQNLIQESLAMIEYNINLLQNLNRAPETAEYSKDMFRGQGGYGNGAGAPGDMPGRFDAKQ